MIVYLVRRFATMLLTLAIISALVFIIINLPPGNYLSNQIAEMRYSGEAAGVAQAEALISQYSLDKPVWQQYFIWVGAMPGPDGFSGLLQGDFGWSFELDRPVAEVVGETAWLTVLVNLSALLFVYLVALPLGTIAAVRANTWIDYTASLIGYIGLATPNFLLALIMLFYGARYFDIPIGGLMAREFEGAPMSWAKIDRKAHVRTPVQEDPVSVLLLEKKKQRVSSDRHTPPPHSIPGDTPFPSFSLTPTSAA